MADVPAADVSVRPATPRDAVAVAAVQARTWREAYADLLPPAALAALDEAALADAWRDAAASPPSPRHHLLVALEGDRVVGLAASAPAEDPGVDPAAETELLLLLVEPAAARAGHGSRLLAASVEAWRADGARRAVTWVLAGDPVTRRFLEGAGWALDGATRELDAGTPLPQLRLHTDLAG